MKCDSCRHAALEHFPEPGPLRPRVAGEIENDRNTLRQHGADVRRDGMSQARRAVEETGHVGDLTRKEALEEFVLDEEDGIAAVGGNLSRASTSRPPSCRTRTSASRS